MKHSLNSSKSQENFISNSTNKLTKLSWNTNSNFFSSNNHNVDHLQISNSLNSNINDKLDFNDNTSSSNISNQSKNSTKSSGKQILFPSKAIESYALLFPNALPVKQVLWAKDNLTNCWRYASIIYARKNENSRPNNVIGPENYDYYIHWEAMDRRLDCWITWDQMRGLEDKLPDGENVCPLSSSELYNNQHDAEHAGMDEEYLREHEENTKLKTIKRVAMGQHLVETWYFSPYPKEYQNIDILHLCEFCLSFFRESSEVSRHRMRCEIRNPPGNEIYRDGNIAMFEIDGSLCRIYCENLCFLSKLFLDHKTLRHPVNLFLFYVMTEIDDYGYHITGYFSKEKYSKNNVSCILTLPQHQRKGYGKFLINFSYALSLVEKNVGTPERPLSDLGKASYMAYWTEKLTTIIYNNNDNISIQDLSNITCIDISDIINCLEEIGILRSAQSGEYFFLLSAEFYDKLKSKSGRETKPIIMKDLHWISYDKYMSPFEQNQY